jgi:hypothetical protein
MLLVFSQERSLLRGRPVDLKNRLRAIDGGKKCMVIYDRVYRWSGVVETLADHLRKFWELRLRDEIKSDLRNGGTGFDPPMREAVQRLVTQDNQ